MPSRTSPASSTLGRASVSRHATVSAMRASSVSPSTRGAYGRRWTQLSDKRADTSPVRRVVIAAVAALAAILSLAAPAQAGPSTRIVIGHDDGTFEVRSVPSSTVDSAIAGAERDNDVDYAERDITLHATSITPNDPMYPQQWGPQAVGAPGAWGVSTGDPPVIVAAVDTGVDSSHADLAGAVLAGKSFLPGGTG